MSKCHEMGPNKYTNIFGCPQINGMNNQIYLRAQDMTKWIFEYIRTKKKQQIWIKNHICRLFYLKKIIFKYGKMGQNNEIGPNKYPCLFAQKFTELISKCIQMSNNDRTNMWIYLVRGNATFENMNNIYTIFN